MKKCTKCNIDKETSDYHADKSKKDNLCSICKTCVKEYQSSIRSHMLEVKREYRHNNKEKIYNYNKIYYENNREIYRASARKMKILYPEKTIAREIVRKAIKSGTVVKPKECSNCGKYNCEIQGHHKDYLKPLDVTWYCRECHGGEHRRLNILSLKNEPIK